MPFQPGQSGNPGGRPKAEREVVELAREASPRAIGRLIELVNHEDPRTAIAASNSVLDRAYGKATQPIAGDDDRPPVRHSVSVDALAKLPKADRDAIRSIARKLAGQS